MIQWPRRQHWSHQALLSLYLFSVFLILTRQPDAVRWGSMFFGVSMLGTATYALLEKGATILKKAIILFMALSTLFAFTFAFLHFPGAGYLSLLCTVNLILFLYLQLKERASYRAELGALTLITAESLIRVILAAHWLF